VGLHWPRTPSFLASLAKRLSSHKLSSSSSFGCPERGFQADCRTGGRHRLANAWFWSGGEAWKWSPTVLWLRFPRKTEKLGRNEGKADSKSRFQWGWRVGETGIQAGLQSTSLLTWSELPIACLGLQFAASDSVFPLSDLGRVPASSFPLSCPFYTIVGLKQTCLDY